ncbi:MAG: DUF2029 domain-containing protein [Anaerolineales bacterium]|nr:DUF2029 domain-containing protein [Anaerolineales bacterium]
MRTWNLEEKQAEKILIIVGIGFCVALAITLNLNKGIVYKSDLLPRWYATRQLITQGRNLYDPVNGMEAFETFAPSVLSPEDASFFYPAHLILVMAGLALLPYRVAYIFWTFLGLFFYLLSIWLCMKTLQFPQSISQRTVVLVMAVLFIPALQHTIWSQFNTITVLSLSLSFAALRKGKFALAGVFATGLTFKPQGLMLTLIFLLIWSIFDRSRWKFILAFFATSVVILTLSYMVQPGWIGDFVDGIGLYMPSFDVKSVLDTIWNPYQILAGLLLLFFVGVLTHNRRASAETPAFSAMIALSIGIWFLVVPVTWMFHLVALPVAGLCVLWALQEIRHPSYNAAMYCLIVLYALGWIGFFIGLFLTGTEGLHMKIMGLFYKVLAIMILCALALPAVLFPGMKMVFERSVQQVTLEG